MEPAKKIWSQSKTDRLCNTGGKRALCAFSLDCNPLQSIDKITGSSQKLMQLTVLVMSYCRALTSHLPPNLGPCLPEMASPWFKFYIYSKLGVGPASLLLPRFTTNLLGLALGGGDTCLDF